MLIPLLLLTFVCSSSSTSFMFRLLSLSCPCKDHMCLTRLVPLNCLDLSLIDVVATLFYVFRVLQAIISHESRDRRLNWSPIEDCSSCCIGSHTFVTKWHLFTWICRSNTWMLTLAYLMLKSSTTLCLWRTPWRAGWRWKWMQEICKFVWKSSCVTMRWESLWPVASVPFLGMKQNDSKALEVKLQVLQVVQALVRCLNHIMIH